MDITNISAIGKDLSAINTDNDIDVTTLDVAKDIKINDNIISLDGSFHNNKTKTLNKKVQLILLLLLIIKKLILIVI